MNDEKMHHARYKVTHRKLNFREVLTIRYTSIFVISFILGLLGYYVLRVPLSEQINSYISTYFSAVFDPSESLTYNCTTLFATSFSDMKTFALIFVSGFTMFSSLAIYWLIFTHAVSLGFSSLYLVNAMSSGGLSEIYFSDLILFLFVSAALSSLMILFASKTRVFNDHFRSLGNSKKLIIRSKPLYLQIYTLLTLCGAVMLINFIRFLTNIF